MVDPIIISIRLKLSIHKLRIGNNSFKAFGFNKPHHFYYEACVANYESFSFQRTKMLQLSTTCFSGFSVEAADNLSNTLMKSTAFLKKSFLRTMPKPTAARRLPVCFEQGGPW
jgi:hypothetical protein